MTGSLKLALVLLLAALVALAPGRMALANVGREAPPRDPFENLFSTNWLASARAALPAKFLKNGTLSFQETTNLLCQESRRGNNAAKSLWGYVLVAQSRSPDEAAKGLQLMEASAGKGHIPAMLNLGWVFENGLFIPADYNQAFHWFGLAAKKGDPEGEFQLGWRYYHGLGFAQDLTQAAKLYRRAAAGTNYNAMRSIGFLLLNGFGVEQDLKEARYWLTRAANEGGSRRAMFNLGALCARGFPDTNSTAEAYHWYQQSADLGDPIACLQVSYCHYRGWGVETSRDRYRSWRLRAANLGATEAQYLMGEACAAGDGVPRDGAASLAWFLKAAAKNHPKALYALAVRYLTGGTNKVSRLVGHDFMLRAAEEGHRDAQFQRALSCFRGDVELMDCESGRRWLAKAAGNGWGRAELVLARMYYGGLAPAPECPPYPRDAVEAVKLFRRASEHQNLEAQSVLGLMLLQGTNVALDKVEGERLLRDAARRGAALAQNDLGFAILNGDTLSSNLVEAAMWCRLAETNSSDPNIAGRALVNESRAMSQASADDWIEVERKVAAFHALPQAEVDPMIPGWESNFDYQEEDGILGLSHPARK